MAETKKIKALKYIPLILMFIIITSWDIAVIPADTRVIAGTAIMEDNNYGGQHFGSKPYCDQFYISETTIIDDNTKEVRFFKSYCSI